MDWQTLARSYGGVHRRPSLMSSSRFFQQCPTCLVRLILIVLEIGGKWPYSYFFVVCCFQDLFKRASSIVEQYPTSFFSIRFVIVYLVHPYSSIDTTAAWKKFRFILSDRSDFNMINSLLIAVHLFPGHILISISVDETRLPGYVNLSTNLKYQPFRVELSPCLKSVYSVLSAFMWGPVPSIACSRLCSRNSAFVVPFERSAI